MGLKTRYPLSAIFTKFHVDVAFDFELSQLSGNRKGVKGNNSPLSFFWRKKLSIIFTIQFFFLFSETLIISQTKSWVSQNNRKDRSEYLNRYSTGQPANHIQAAASWLATAAKRTKGRREGTKVPHWALLVYIPHSFVINSNFSEARVSSAEQIDILNFQYGLQDGYLSSNPHVNPRPAGGGGPKGPPPVVFRK